MTTYTAEASTEYTTKNKDITPINQESPFDIHELFFSVTNPLSVIKYGNDVFLRTAKYKSDEIFGQYHNIIRHPDMPMAAFRIMWEYLLNKQSVAVYVKNLASDGSYYWVMALMLPTEDGYLSIRLKPTSPLFEKIKSIYHDTLTFEKELSKTNDREYTAKASKSYLIEQLAKEGFDSYDNFMKHALVLEVLNREKSITDRYSHFEFEGNEEVEKLVAIHKILCEMVVFSDKLETMHQNLLKYSNFILHLSNTILSIAINARLQSSKLDQADQSLSVISEKMGEQTQWGEESLKHIISIIGDMYNLFGKLNFDVISSKLQVEMSLINTYEFLASEHAEDDPSEFMNNHHRVENYEETKELLTRTYSPLLSNIQKHIFEIPFIQNQIQNSIKDIEKYLTILRFIYITGKVEITRMTQKDDSFQETFEDLIKELEAADKHLSNLRTVINENNSLFKRYGTLNTQLRELM